MARKSLRRLTSPQLWYKEQKNGLIEVAVIENFGSGPAFWCLWVPIHKDDAKVKEVIARRMAKDYNIDLVNYNMLASPINPINLMPVKELQR